MDDTLKDERFKHIGSDPRYRRVPRKERKVEIDERFKSMFTDESFKIKACVDERGRPQKRTTKEHLKDYYSLASDEEETEVEQNADGKAKAKGKNESESDEEKEIDYARGEGNLESSSEDEDGSSEDENNELDHQWGEFDQTETADKISRRLAVCSMDWDRISVQDVYFLCKSFTPVGGVIKSVKIYLSNYGRERLALEEVNGPAELTENKDYNEDDETPEGDKFHREKLRQYQMNRLKYYYAVVECDNAETAAKIYDECDGLEFESSGTKVNLSFIPDDMEFNEEPHSEADLKLDASSYRPKTFTTTALQSSSVQLTWDETNPNRTEIIHKAFDKKEEEDMDLKVYLASSDDDDDEVIVPAEKEPQSKEETSLKPADKIAKYKALLQDIEGETNKKDDDIEMEISWGVGLKEKTQELLKKKQKEKEEKDMNPWEKYLNKSKEKKKLKLQSKKQADNEVEKSDSENEYSDDDDIPSDIDLNDPYFKEELDSDKKGKKKLSKKKKTNINDKQLPTNSSLEDDEKRKAELSLLLMNDEEEHKKHYSLKKLIDNASDKKKKKKLKQKDKPVVEDDFQMDLEDPRFSALYTSHLFNIDPSEPQFKKTKGVQQIMEEKRKRRLKQEEESLINKKTKLNEDIPQTSTNLKTKEKAELSSLVKSIKSKTNSFNRNTKKAK